MINTKKIRLITLVIFIFSCFIFAIDRDKQKTDMDVDILLGQKIAMRDGVRLSANVYKPAVMKQPLPAIFAFTPYISDEGQERGPFFARHGYVYVHVDVRGRGNSEGEFFPLEKDGVDGARVVEWIARQPWCNGKVGMRGGSYRGMVQWQTLQYFPTALKTIVPTAAAAPGVDFPMVNNIFTSYITQWLAFTMNKTNNSQLFSDQSYWQHKFYKLYRQHLPFARLAEITGSNREIFQRWISHPFYDSYWRDMALKDEVYAKIAIPVLTITGHFDGDQPGAMHYFHKHMRFGKPEIKNKHYLIVGPWSHGGTRHPSKKLAGLEFADNALVNMEQLHLDWYDWTLKGKTKPTFLKKRICYYMMNENQWRYCDHLNEISNGKLVFYLSSKGGKAQDVFSSGFLKPSSPEGRQAADAFTYDPLKLMSKEEYIRQANASFLDQSAAFQQDKLIYHSQPLKDVVEIAGTIKLTLFIKLNVPDTDLGIRLYEIKPDGQSILLAQDFLRARYGKSLARPELVTPGKIYKYIFDKSYFFARTIHKGSRLRLIVSGLNTPVFEKNYNSGGVVSRETAKDSRTAIIQLYHDKRHPSRLELPVFKK